MQFCVWLWWPWAILVIWFLCLLMKSLVHLMICDEYDWCYSKNNVIVTVELHCSSILFEWELDDGNDGWYYYIALIPVKWETILFCCAVCVPWLMCWHELCRCFFFCSACWFLFLLLATHLLLLLACPVLICASFCFLLLLLIILLPLIAIWCCLACCPLMLPCSSTLHLLDNTPLWLTACLLVWCLWLLLCPPMLMCFCKLLLMLWLCCSPSACLLFHPCYNLPLTALMGPDACWPCLLYSVLRCLFLTLSCCIQLLSVSSFNLCCCSTADSLYDCSSWLFAVLCSIWLLTAANACSMPTDCCPAAGCLLCLLWCLHVMLPVFHCCSLCSDNCLLISCLPPAVLYHCPALICTALRWCLCCSTCSCLMPSAECSVPCSSALISCALDIGLSRLTSVICAYVLIDLLLDLPAWMMHQSCAVWLWSFTVSLILLLCWYDLCIAACLSDAAYRLLALCCLWYLALLIAPSLTDALVFWILPALPVPFVALLLCSACFFRVILLFLVLQSAFTAVCVCDSCCCLAALSAALLSCPAVAVAFWCPVCLLCPSISLLCLWTMIYVFICLVLVACPLLCPCCCTGLPSLLFGFMLHWFCCVLLCSLLLGVLCIPTCHCLPPVSCSHVCLGCDRCLVLSLSACCLPAVVFRYCSCPWFCPCLHCCLVLFLPACCLPADVFLAALSAMHVLPCCPCWLDMPGLLWPMLLSVWSYLGFVISDFPTTHVLLISCACSGLLAQSTLACASDWLHSLDLPFALHYPLFSQSPAACYSHCADASCLLMLLLLISCPALIAALLCLLVLLSLELCWQWLICSRLTLLLLLAAHACCYVTLILMTLLPVCWWLWWRALPLPLPCTVVLLGFLSLTAYLQSTVWAVVTLLCCCLLMLTIYRLLPLYSLYPSCVAATYPPPLSS